MQLENTRILHHHERNLDISENAARALRHRGGGARLAIEHEFSEQLTRRPRRDLSLESLDDRVMRLFTCGHHRCFNDEFVRRLASARTSGGTRSANWNGVKFAPIHSAKKSGCGAPPNMAMWRKKSVHISLAKKPFSAGGRSRAT